MRIHHIAITVKNLEKSVSFYKENFNFREVKRFSKPSWNGGNAAVLELGETCLELFCLDKPVDMKDDLMDLRVIGLKHIAISVENVHEKHAELMQKGIEIDEPKKGTICKWYCYLRDPDNIPIELYETN